MFSPEEKCLIAAKLEEVILSLRHPEMPKEKPRFRLHVDGAEAWSWAYIEPNWMLAEKTQPPCTTCGGGPYGSLQEWLGHECKAKRWQ